MITKASLTVDTGVELQLGFDKNTQAGMLAGWLGERSGHLDWWLSIQLNHYMLC